MDPGALEPNRQPNPLIARVDGDRRVYWPERHALPAVVPERRSNKTTDESARQSPGRGIRVQLDDIRTSIADAVPQPGGVHSERRDESGEPSDLGTGAPLGAASVLDLQRLDSSSRHADLPTLASENH